MTFRLDESIAIGRFVVGAIPRPDERIAEWLVRLDAWISENPTHPMTRAIAPRLDRQAEQIDIARTIAWALYGFPRVLVGHRLAAALMATHAGDDPDVLGFAPWCSYTIEIPPDVVALDVGGRKVSIDVAAVFHHRPDALSLVTLMSRSSDFAMTCKLEFPLPDFVDSEDIELSTDTEATMLRARDCMIRLVVSTQLEMSDPTRVKVPSTKKAPREDSTAPGGLHRLVREVKIDCREAIASFVSGHRKSSPTLRTLVRGHFKRVAIGEGRAGRKWTHIEPYWRGPDDAPVAVRPHQFPKE